MEKNDLSAYLAEHAETEKASFHMPGHKGSEFFARLGYGDRLARIADHDITEIPGADDLRHPEGIIKALTDKYAALYGSDRAFISVNGSSALIMASIMTCVEPGHKLLAASDSHISVKNGAALAGAEIMYIKPQVLDAGFGGAVIAPGSISGDGDGFPAGLSADSVAKALDKDHDIDAVILPSPNYFGIVSDIKAIADEVHRRGKILIVDQAHGAHLKMFADAGRAAVFVVQRAEGAASGTASGRATMGDCSSMLPLPAEECGADIVVVSTHKTIASFTQTAVVNIFSGRVDPDEYEKKLLMLESTSPSYVLMESLAINAEIMEKHGRELADSWRADLDWFYKNAETLPVIRVLTRDMVRGAGADLDDSKIVVDFSGAMLSGKEAEEILIEKGIYPEFHTGSIVMFLTGIGNVRKDYDLLIEALAEIAWRDPFSDDMK